MCRSRIIISESVPCTRPRWSGIVSGEGVALRISIFGCGYVGLVTGARLAEIGHDVVCTDNNDGKIRTLQEGGVPIYEPTLDRVLERTL